MVKKKRTSLAFYQKNIFKLDNEKKKIKFIK